MPTLRTEVAATRKPPRARPKDSRELLMNLAAKLFRERGYAEVSIRDIVKGAKIEPSALYYHFASKEALVDAVLERSIQGVMAEVRTAVDELAPDASPRDRFRVAIATHLRSITQHGDFALASRRVIGQIPKAIQKKHDAMRADYGAYWQSLFDDAAHRKQFRGDARLGLGRMFLLGALNWSSEWFNPKLKTPEEMAAIFCSFLFDGLAPPPSGRTARSGRR